MEDLKWQRRGKGEAAVRRKRSQRVQFGEIFSFPKKVMKVKITLSEIMPAKKRWIGLPEHIMSKGLRRGF